MPHSLRRFFGKVPLERALQYRGARLGRRIRAQAIAEASKEDRSYKAIIRGLQRQLQKKLVDWNKKHPFGQQTPAQQFRAQELGQQIQLLGALEKVGRKPHAQDLAVSMMLHAGLSETALRPLLNRLYTIEYAAKSRRKPAPFRGAITGTLHAVQGNWLEQIEQMLHSQKKALGPEEIRTALGVSPKNFKALSRSQQNQTRSRITTALGLLDLAKLATKMPVRSGTTAFPYVHAEHRQTPVTLQAARENLDYLILKELVEGGPALRYELLEKPPKAQGWGIKNVGTRMKVESLTLRFFIDNAIQNGLLETRPVKIGVRFIERLQATPLARKWIRESEEKGFLVAPFRKALLGEKKIELSHSDIVRLQAIKETWRALDFWFQHSTLSKAERLRRFGKRLHRVVYRKTRGWRGLKRESADRFLAIWKKQARLPTEKASIARLEKYLDGHPEELRS